MRTKSRIASAVAVCALAALVGSYGCSKDEGPTNPPGDPNAFNSGTLGPGATFSKVFPNATSSAIGYHCNIHSNMTGSVTVANGQPAMVEVAIQNSGNDGFNPKNVSVAPGGTVRWTNADATSHTATSH